MVNLLKKIINYFGIYIFRNDWKRYYFNIINKNNNRVPPIELYKKFYKNQNDLVIFDVGANTGQTVLKFTKKIKFQEIHCFEPNAQAFKKLSKFSSKNIIVNNFALGENEVSKNFYNYPKSSSSSFLKISKHSKIYDMNKNFNISEVQIKTVDSYLKKKEINKINILKIDTQGYDTKVLIGAKEAIKNSKIDFIETEINLGFQYEAHSSFKEVEDLLFENYRLILIEEDGNIFSNKDYQTNILYASHHIVEKLK